MKNSNFRLIGMLILAILFSVNTSIFAQRGNGKCNGTGKGQGKGDGTGNYCNNIPNLTSDQQTKIDQLKTAHLKEMQALRNEAGEKRARLQTLRSADKADMVAINKTIDEQSVIQTNMSKKREQHFQDVRNVLTADQKVYFDSKGHGNGYGCGNGNGKGRGRGNGNCRN